MRVGTSLATVALVVSLAACGGGLKTSYDFNPSANFTNYQTWAWMNMPNNAQLSELNQQRVRTAIERGLAGKGLRQVTDNPDMWVGFQVVLDEEVSYNTVNNYYGTGWGYPGWYGPRYGGVGMTMGSSQTYENRVTVGTLFIDMFDAGSKDLVYRGTGESKIQEVRDPAERQQRLDDAVVKILETYPPSRN